MTAAGYQPASVGLWNHPAAVAEHLAHVAADRAGAQIPWPVRQRLLTALLTVARAATRECDAAQAGHPLDGLLDAALTDLTAARAAYTAAESRAAP